MLHKKDGERRRKRKHKPRPKVKCLEDVVCSAAASVRVEDKTT